MSQPLSKLILKYENFNLTPCSSDELIVMTTHTNDPKFLEIQAALLSKHLKHPFRFVAGIDLSARGSSGDIYGVTIEDFQDVAKKWDIELLVIPKAIHWFRYRIFPHTKQTIAFSDAALKCADAVQFMLNNVSWNEFRALLFLDADMFPIRDIINIPVNEITPIAAVQQSRSFLDREIKYAWNGLFWLNGNDEKNKSINFDILWEHRIITDVGGCTHEFLTGVKKEGKEVFWMKHLSSESWSLKNLESEFQISTSILNWLEQDYRNSADGSFFSELYTESFLHYRGGGNWSNNNKDKERENRTRLYQAIT